MRTETQEPPARLAAPTDAAAAPATCVSCGAPTDAPYCPRCGERRAADRRYTLRAFATEAFETVTNADSTLWRTFATLLRRPGELTRAYMHGVRAPYMKPLQLFLVVNVLYFVWAGFSGERVFNTRLRNHLANTNYGADAQARVVAKVAARGGTARDYAAVFDAAATVQSKSLIVTMVPMLALFVGALEIRRRRPFVQHLVFALHFYTTLLLFAIAQRYVVLWPLRLGARAGGMHLTDGAEDNVVSWVMLTAVVVYTSLALRRAYDDGRAASLVKGALVSFAVLVVLLLYRVLLFYTTLWAT
jgi:hypothetical protein